MVKIRCVVERITYQNPGNGYTVLKASVKGYRELVPVVGNLLDANVGSVLIVEGNWKIDAQYGRQFMAEKWEERNEFCGNRSFCENSGSGGKGGSQFL